MASKKKAAPEVEATEEQAPEEAAPEVEATEESLAKRTKLIAKSDPTFPPQHVRRSVLKRVEKTALLRWAAEIGAKNVETVDGAIEAILMHEYGKVE